MSVIILCYGNNIRERLSTIVVTYSFYGCLLFKEIQLINKIFEPSVVLLLREKGVNIKDHRTITTKGKGKEYLYL